MREATLCVPYDIGMPEQSISYSTRQILGAVKSRVLRVNDLSYIFENRSRRRLSLTSAHIEVSGRTMNVKLVEPPSCNPAASNVILIGRNRHGYWIAREKNGLFGGLFVNRAEAIKYALFENGRHPETIIELSREIELDIPSGDPHVAGVRRVT